MKKLFFIALAVFLTTAGLAGATDFSITGSYYSRGTYVDNWDGTGANESGDSYGVFDQELSIDPVWTIDDNTKVFSRFEIRDDNWAETYDYDTDVDDTIEVQRAWGEHTFANGGVLSVGQMTGGAWATAFGDAADAAYRIKYVKPTNIGSVIGLYEKKLEGGTTNDDIDLYGPLLVTKAGGITWTPALLYVDYETNETSKIIAMLGAAGTFGNLGFESEFIYEDVDVDSGNDYTLIGLYGNGWMNFDALKVGALAAYGNEDEGNFFDFNDDFTAGGALLLGDDMFMNGSPDALAGVTMFAGYFDYAVTEKLSFGAYLGYASSNADTGQWNDASAWELSADTAYKITPNLTYSVAAGTAEFDYADGYTDPDAALEVYHKLAFSF